MGLICKQPNGDYCRFSSIVNAPTHIGMSIHDLKRYLLDTNQLDYERQKVEDWLSLYAKPFQVGLRICTNLNQTWEEFEEFLDEVGYQGNRNQYKEQFRKQR